VAARVSQAILLSQVPPAQAETRVSRSTCGIVARSTKENYVSVIFESERENWKVGD
jgi:hypothetical protein